MQPNQYPTGYGQYQPQAPTQYPQPGNQVMTGAPMPQFQQPQYTPQSQPVPPMPATNMQAGNLPQGDFADPRAGSGELAPRIRHLIGRTVIIEPLRVDENAKGMKDSSGNIPTRPAAFANVTVVDGGPIAFGNELNGGREIKPNDRQVNTPYRIMNMMISNTYIVSAIREALPPMGNGLLLGVIEEGTQGNRPPLLTKCETTVNGQDRPDGAQRREAARQLWQQIKAGQFTNQAPTLLQPVAGSAYAQQSAPQQYQQAPAQYAPQGGYGGMDPSAQQQYGAPSYGPAGTPGYTPQQQPMPAGPAGLPPGFDVTQVPPGWDAGAWAGFAANPQQAATIWTNVIAQNPAILNQAPAALQGQQQYTAGQLARPDGPGW